MSDRSDGGGRLLHVLGGGAWQLPTIELAQRLGHRVLVTDMYEERPAYARADLHEVVDLKDGAGTLDVARRHDIDGILCDTTDAGVVTMARVAEALGLPSLSPDAAIRFTDKGRMRETLAAAGLPGPAFRVVTSQAQLSHAAGAIGYPVVVKPTDSQSSRGVSVVRGEADLGAAYRAASAFASKGRLIVEAFLEGTELTVEGYAVRKAVHACGISEKVHFAGRPGVASRLTWPADLSSVDRAAVADLTARAVRALGLETGIFHAELILGPRGVSIVEIAARGGGSHVYSHVLPHLAGVAVPEMVVRHALGEDAWTPPKGTAGAACLVFPELPVGRVTRIDGVEAARALPGVAVVLLEFAVGDRLTPPTDDRSRLAQVLVLGTRRDEVLETAERAVRTIRVETA